MASRSVLFSASIAVEFEELELELELEVEVEVEVEGKEIWMCRHFHQMQSRLLKLI